MTTRNSYLDDQRLDASRLGQALETVSIRLRDNRAEPQEIVVCGGSALILTGDVSEGFASILKDMLGSIGYAKSADRL